ncbi:hypothetical protein F4782DRAFT_470760 [Xylaria castorea]|nr:hypothetical protein F4782DRAFT_470760 [Xylaria castorea]
MPSTPPPPPSVSSAPHIELLRRLVHLDLLDHLDPMYASDITRQLSPSPSPSSATFDISSPSSSPSATSPSRVDNDAQVRSHIQQLVSAASLLVGAIPASPCSEITVCALFPASVDMPTSSSSSASRDPPRTPIQPYICLLRSLAALDPPCADQIPDEYVRGWVTLLISWACAICEHLLRDQQEASSNRATESI